MEAELIKWDTENFEGNAKMLRQETENLSAQRGFLKDINSIVEDAWQGVAGASFDKLMDVDIENFDRIISSLEALIEDLEKITKNCYHECEDQIAKKVRDLSSRIR